MIATQAQATLVLIKPDAMKRGLLGTVLSYLDRLGLELVGAKLTRVSRPLAEAHYHHIRTKPFFEETVEYLQGKLHGTRAILALVLWGDDAIERVRQVIGATHPEKAEPMSIRGALGRMATNGLMENVIHSSSDSAEAKREIALWFAPHEVLLDDSPSPRAAMSG